jgi:hypothetical protein
MVMIHNLIIHNLIKFQGLQSSFESRDLDLESEFSRHGGSIPARAAAARNRRSRGRSGKSCDARRSGWSCVAQTYGGACG